MSEQRRPEIKASDLSGMLADRIKGLVAQLGLDGAGAYEAKDKLFPLNPTRADRHPGSMYVYLSGERRGYWTDKATGDRGDALDLVAYVLYRGNGKEAFKWAINWLGIDSTPAPAIREAADKVRHDREKREKDAAEKAARMRKAARRLWLSGEEPAPGGLCDRYLKGRGIDFLGVLGHLPGCVRETQALKAPDDWLGEHPALLLAVHDGAGFAACHRIYLKVHEDGHVTKALLDPARPEKFTKDGVLTLPKNRSKFVYGNYWGGSIRITRGPSGKRLGDLKADDLTGITEGFENGCVVAVACADTDDDHRIIAALSLSNMGAVELPDCIRTVMLYGENDGSPQARADFERAVAMHLDAGRTVYKTWPPASVNDANDLLNMAEPVA